MYGDISKGVIAKNMPDESLRCGKKFYEDFASVISEPESFQILSFHQIGMLDPFPDEIQTDFVIPIDEGDLVYAENRYIFNSSPNTMYFPSKMILF